MISDSSSSVHIPKLIFDEISVWSKQAFPHEGCGLLIGRFEPLSLKRVVRFARLSNELLSGKINAAPTLPLDRQGQGAGRTEFVMNPAEFNAEYLKAEQDGLDVVGVVHTHPNHPPRPSAIDSSQPFLAQWSNIIVSVMNGETVEMRSWFRESDDKSFVEEPIFVI